jgi:cyclohexyl-isocyanide hydratase
MATSLRVGMVLYDGCTLLDFAGATQVFAFAPGFEVVWLAPTLDPIETTESVKVLPHCTFADAGDLDIVFVPGGGDAVGTVMQDSTYVDFVRAAGSQARMAGSICTGAFIVAAAGLFDDCEVTTYWSQRENLALFPSLRVSAGYPRFVIHGDRFSGGGIRRSSPAIPARRPPRSRPPCARARRASPPRSRRGWRRCSETAADRRAC